MTPEGKIGFNQDYKVVHKVALGGQKPTCNWGAASCKGVFYNQYKIATDYMLKSC